MPKMLHTFTGVYTLPLQAQAVLCRYILNNDKVNRVGVKHTSSDENEQSLDDTLIVIGWNGKTIVDVVEVNLGIAPTRGFKRFCELADAKSARTKNKQNGK